MQINNQPFESPNHLPTSLPMVNGRKQRAPLRSCADQKEAEIKALARVLYNALTKKNETTEN